MLIKLSFSNWAEASMTAEAIAALKGYADQGRLKGISKMLLKFDGNKFDVKNLKNRLSQFAAADKLMKATQYSAPAIGGVLSYSKARREGFRKKEALKRAGKGALGGAALSLGLTFPRHSVKSYKKLHEALSLGVDHGYHVLESAAEKAEKRLNKPSWLRKLIYGMGGQQNAS